MLCRFCATEKMEQDIIICLEFQQSIEKNIINFRIRVFIDFPKKILRNMEDHLLDHEVDFKL